MVKAASYGAGDFEVAQLLQHQGVDYLAVAFADEGVLLRERGITMPVVVLNADADSFDAMAANRLEPEIYSLRSLHEFAAAVERYGEQRYPIHVKLDTGMHRLGFVEEELPALLDALARYGRTVRVASVFAHLCTSDDPAQDDFTRLQIARFDRMSSRIAEALPYPVLPSYGQFGRDRAFSRSAVRHVPAGAGALRLRIRAQRGAVSRLDAAHPHRADQAAGSDGDGGLRPCGGVVAADGDGHRAIGYADGLDRHLGCGAWSMRVKGRPAPIVGRVCMDSCMIDVTDIDGVAEGDEAVVFSPAAGNTPEAMAEVLGTIPYEILTSVAGRVKRIYLKE